MRYFINFFYIALFFILTGSPAYAHWADMAAMELTVTGQKADATLTLPTPFLKEVDKDKNGIISNQEVTESKELIKKILEDQVYLKGDGEPGKLEILSQDGPGISIAGANNQSTLHLQWTWDSPPQYFNMHYSLFPKEAVNAKCLVSADIDKEVRTIIFDQNNLDRPLKVLTTIESIRQFLYMGVEHIATGYDHILFLIALILAGGSFRYLIKIVTAFTLAHSITLSLAVLGIVSVPARISESCIALSIMYVAAENLWRKKDEAHWLLVFLFGLVHGLGFANVLREMQIPREQLVVSLVSFNLGIEMGQLVIVITSWFLLNRLLLKAKPDWYKKLKPVGSIAIFCMATVWFVQRAFLGL